MLATLGETLSPNFWPAMLLIVALPTIGLVALVGSVTCLLTALTLVPALMGRREEPS